MAHRAACIGIIEISHEAVKAIRSDTASGGDLFKKMEATAVESAKATAGGKSDVQASSMLERDCVQLIVHVILQGESPVALQYVNRLPAVRAHRAVE